MGEFRTMAGYDRESDGGPTRAMEDYLEMICRLSGEAGTVRMTRLAAELHVKPSSASKMAEHLRAAGLIEYEKYGLLTPTEEGRRLGEYLLHRHRVLQEFLCRINGTQDELELVERIEHFIDARTVANMEAFLEGGTGADGRDPTGETEGTRRIP